MVVLERSLEELLEVKELARRGWARKCVQHKVQGGVPGTGVSRQCGWAGGASRRIP